MTISPSCWSVRGLEVDWREIAKSGVEFLVGFKTAWPEIKGVLELAAMILVSSAAIMAMFRLRTIAQVVRDFRHSEGPIETIRNAAERIQDFGRIEPVVKSLSEELKFLGDKIDAAQRQVAEQQRLITSERTEAAPPSDSAAPQEEDIPAAPSLATSITDIDANWIELREIWYRNTTRIETVISSITDGRRKLKYDRLPRYQYNPIIDSLERDGKLSNAAATASKRLNQVFMSFRPRNRPVPDEILGAMRLLDAQLAQEIGEQALGSGQ